MGHPVSRPFTVSDHQQQAAVVGSEAWTARRPFVVDVVPADLVAGLRR